MKTITLYFIKFIHLLVVLYVVLTPFINIKFLLGTYLFLIPVMIIHWICNDNTCILTSIEKKIRQESGDYTDNNCFTCKIIDPIYNFNDNSDIYSVITYVSTICLWLYSIYVVIGKIKNKEISKFDDMFRI